MPLTAAQDAGHPGKAAGIAVLLVEGQTILLAGGIEVIHPLAVFGVIRGIHLDDGVDALAAGVDQGGTGQLQLLDDGLLSAQIHVVAFHQSVAVGGDIGILAARSVHRVEADPRAHLGVAVAHHLADVPAAGVQLCDELACGAVPAASGGAAAVVGHEALGHIGHVLVLFKEGLQVAPELVNWVPLLRQSQVMGFHPPGVHQLPLRSGGAGGELVAPVQRVARGAAPSVAVGQLENAALGDRLCAAVKALPLPGTLTLVVAAPVPGAPCFPDGDGQARFLEAHAHHRPLLISQGGRGNEVQCFFEFDLIIHLRDHTSHAGVSGGAGGV